MAATDALAALAALVIFGMIWLRTKVQYRRSGVILAVTRAGWQYFAAAAVLMAAGWGVAPLLRPLIVQAGQPGAPILPTLLRVGWFLATYYLFIAVHQLVKSRGAAVFGPADGSAPEV